MKKSLFYLFILTIVVLSGCKKKDTPDKNSSTPNVPTLTTTAVSAITQTSAQSGGNISSDGGAAITAKGVCWGTSQNPTTSNSISANDVENAVSFSNNVSGLNANTTYYVRAFATNSAGTGYGNQVSFTTLQANTIADYDGNMYQVITIGTQTWMKENLKTTHYMNGDAISNISDNAQWSAQTSGACCSYTNNSANINTYGLLYNWYAVNDVRNIAPTGWHVPTDNDWQILSIYLGGSNTAGDKLKESGTTHWATGNTGNNSSGFTAFAGGYRTNTGSFGDMGNTAGFWTATLYTATNSWSRSLVCTASFISRNSFIKSYGYSVRLVKD